MISIPRTGHLQGLALNSAEALRVHDVSASNASCFGDVSDELSMSRRLLEVNVHDLYATCSLPSRQLGLWTS